MVAVVAPNARIEAVACGWASGLRLRGATTLAMQMYYKRHAEQTAQHNQTEIEGGTTPSRRFQRAELQRSLTLPGRLLVLGVVEFAGVAARRHLVLAEDQILGPHDF